MTTHPGHPPTWRKSSRSGSGNNCVEVAILASSRRAVRDSKDPDGPKLAFTTEEWLSFIARLKAGHLNLP